ncbi:GntR family transcriptional regulator [Niveispirillum sp.]|uniref:GntR family transcriptional regulator n=1 Tax=Niveispirillum sp. TaxID=1917217 RepID=UPI001B7C7FE7|nr:GntR family transcriptional regulator [Niveispirillum sp.]MBP7337570.1 GntR family transcriptional regulator [Niveispirillum sp.]
MAIATVPRYQQIAQLLRAAITDGTYKVGDLLPTEQELCARHGISRHTARDALRLLTDAGLVTRKRRAGTMVAAATEPALFVQPLGGFQDLLQYARSARLTILAYGPAPADGMARDLGLDPGDWRELRGLRREGAKVVGLTRVLIRADCAPLQGEIEESPTIADAVEARFGMVASRIDQQISAMVLDSRLAALLGSEPGAAALRTRRTYHDARGALFLASESAHPADRFVYSMSFNRERE